MIAKSKPTSRFAVAIVTIVKVYGKHHGYGSDQCCQRFALVRVFTLEIRRIIDK